VLIGAFAAYICKMYHAPFERTLRFDFEFFMTFLLPPIIFEAGYNMNVRAFFGNLGPTAFFAFIGTFASTFIVGGIVWYAGQLGYCYPLGLLASLTFGSLISATDPVTVLAVFSKLGVKVDLFSMVFGESVLNDAVAIVLSRTLLSFNEPGAAVDGPAIKAAALSFVIIFVGSSLIGIFFGCLASIVYKYLGLRFHHAHINMETSLTFVFPWAAYYMTEALELSGIVAILMAGITMALFMRHSLSKAAASSTTAVYKVIAQIAETYVFVYLGMAFVVFPIFDHVDWPLFGIALIACFIGRLHTVVGSALTNCLVKCDKRRSISPQYTFLLWFSGLRGGVAFALASVSYGNNDFPNRCGGLADVGPLTAEQAAANGQECVVNDGLVILQTTLLIAAFTIFVFGGAITDVAIKLKVLEDKSPAGLRKAKSESHVGTSDVWFRIDRVLTPFLSVGKMDQRVADRDHVYKVLSHEHSTVADLDWYFRQENEWALARMLEHITNVQSRFRGILERKNKRMANGSSPTKGQNYSA